MGLNAALLALTTLQAPLPSLPTIPREFRAVWVATVDNIDWPSKRTLTTAQQQEEMIRIFDRAKELNLNAVIFQIRPTADALYESRLEPWSEYLTNEQGKAPNPRWDPLQFAIDQARKRGMELHTWFNPYRAQHPAQKGPAHSSHISKTNPDVVKQYGRFLWMDPGEKLVQDRSHNVFMDVARRYDVDGIHIDDYFYPYPERDANQKPVSFPDEASYQKYLRGGGKLNRDDWRRKNVDDFIERFYTTLKRERRHVKFGISPFGIYRPGIPEGIRAGVDQYAELYADALKWYQNGWCDYFTPQLYWPITQTPQAYPVLLRWWAANNPKGIHFWPGNFTGQTMAAPIGRNWPAKEIIDQIDLTRSMKGATGNVHFSMRSLMANSNGISDALKNGPYRTPAFVPASPWLGRDVPPTPTGSVNGDSFTFTSNERIFAVTTLRNGRWQPWMNTGEKTVRLSRGQGDTAVAVVALSRTGIESKPLIVRL